LVNCSDSGNRCHSIQVKEEDKEKASIVCTSIPEIIQKPQTVHFVELSFVISDIFRLIENCQGFWNVVSAIDKECTVLDPKKPTLDCTFRTIILAPKCYLRMQFDPRHPFNVPEMKFIGSRTKDFERLYCDNVRSWYGRCKGLTLRNRMKSVKENLSNILKTSIETNLPLPSQECGCCYSERLNGNLPDISCSNDNCDQSFHRTCIYEVKSQSIIYPSGLRCFQVRNLV
jgi:hypothetical protein